MGVKKYVSHSNKEEDGMIAYEDLIRAFSKNSGNNKLEIEDFTSKKILLTGESYCSILNVVDVTVKEENEETKKNILQLFVKRAFLDNKLMEPVVVFKKEILIYSVLIPAYHRLESELGIKESEIAPKYFGHQFSRDDENVDLVDEYSLLLLENMSARDYYVCDRFLGLDYDHAKKSLSVLSRYHANGMALNNKKPDFFKKILGEIKQNSSHVDYIKMIYHKYFQALKSQPQLKEYIPIIETCFFHRKKNENELWRTVCHGDFRLNNILFYNDNSGTVDDVKIIDFQICSYESPLRDLVYFLITSLDNKTLNNRIDDLIDFYYDSLISRLKLLTFDEVLFSRADFDRELIIESRNQFPFATCVAKFCMYRMKEEDNTNSDRLIETVLDSKMTEDYIEKLIMVMNIYTRKGWA